MNYVDINEHLRSSKQEASFHEEKKQGCEGCDVDTEAKSTQQDTSLLKSLSSKLSASQYKPARLIINANTTIF